MKRFRLMAAALCAAGEACIFLHNTFRYIPNSREREE